MFDRPGESETVATSQKSRTDFRIQDSKKNAVQSKIKKIKGTCHEGEAVTNFRLQDTEEQSAVHGKIKKLKGLCHEGKAVQIYYFMQEMKGTIVCHDGKIVATSQKSRTDFRLQGSEKSAVHGQIKK